MWTKKRWPRALAIFAAAVFRMVKSSFPVRNKNRFDVCTVGFILPVSGVENHSAHQRLTLDGKEPFSPWWIVYGLTDGRVWKVAIHNIAVGWGDSTVWGCLVFTLIVNVCHLINLFRYGWTSWTPKLSRLNGGLSNDTRYSHNSKRTHL